MFKIKFMLSSETKAKADVFRFRQTMPLSRDKTACESGNLYLLYANPTIEFEFAGNFEILYLEKWMVLFCFLSLPKLTRWFPLKISPLPWICIRMASLILLGVVCSFALRPLFRAKEISLLKLSLCKFKTAATCRRILSSRIHTKPVLISWMSVA